MKITMPLPRIVHYTILTMLMFLIGALPAGFDHQDRKEHLDRQGRLDHRSDYIMDSISGGNFRDYVSTHITEKDRWALSMRTFGSFHNFMHELMTQMVRHGENEHLERGETPDFSNRISGGQWSDYRQTLEDAGDDSPWYELVRITEIMHDRVHHAMARSLLYDHHVHSRDADPEDYLRGDILDFGEGIPDPDERSINTASLDEFREWAWRYDADTPEFHSSVQKMAVFAHMLDDMLTQWLEYGEEHSDPDCSPADGNESLRSAAWPNYAQQIVGCEDPLWRELVLVSDLMRDRIHHMMYKLMAYAD